LLKELLPKVGKAAVFTNEQSSVQLSLVQGTAWRLGLATYIKATRSICRVVAINDLPTSASEMMANRERFLKGWCAIPAAGRTQSISDENCPAKFAVFGRDGETVHAERAKLSLAHGPRLELTSTLWDRRPVT